MFVALEEMGKDSAINGLRKDYSTCECSYERVKDLRGEFHTAPFEEAKYSDSE
jgi:hypothetical protein